MARSAMNKTSRTRREILKIEKAQSIGSEFSRSWAVSGPGSPGELCFNFSGCEAWKWKITIACFGSGSPQNCPFGGASGLGRQYMRYLKNDNCLLSDAHDHDSLVTYTLVQYVYNIYDPLWECLHCILTTCINIYCLLYNTHSRPADDHSWRILQHGAKLT